MTIPDLTGFKALSFDCYGTLIDWEAGLAADLEPITSRLAPDHEWRTRRLAAVERFNAYSEQLWAMQPSLAYDANLAEAFRRLADEAGLGFPDPELDAAAERIGTGPGRWPAFCDTVAALHRLRARYKLVVLSNVDDANIARAVAGSLEDVGFDAVYTAQAVGSYKPSHANFEYLFAHARADLGVDKDAGELLHVARSLTADHVHAKALGLRSVWIARGGDRPDNYGTGGALAELTAQRKVAFEWKFDTLADFADEVDRQFAAKGQVVR